MPTASCAACSIASMPYSVQRSAQATMSRLFFDVAKTERRGTGDGNPSGVVLGAELALLTKRLVGFSTLRVSEFDSMLRNNNQEWYKQGYMMLDEFVDRISQVQCHAMTIQCTMELVVVVHCTVAPCCDHLVQWWWCTGLYCCSML